VGVVVSHPPHSRGTASSQVRSRNLFFIGEGFYV